MRVATGFLTVIFLFLYGTGQMICLCDSADTCAGAGNLLSHAESPVQEIKPEQNMSAGGCFHQLLDCCSGCVHPENLVLGTAINNLVEICTLALLLCQAIFVALSIFVSALSSSRDPPRFKPIRLYLQKRVLLI